MDVGFFVFDLPWLPVPARLRVRRGRRVALIAAAVDALPVRRAPAAGAAASATTAAARVHLSVLLGVFVLLQGGRLLARPLRPGLPSDGPADHRHDATPTSTRVLPAKTILAVRRADLRGAVLRRRSWRRTWLLPGVGVGLLVLSAILLGGIYPALVQQLPGQARASRPGGAVHQRNIEATRAAYGLDDVEVQPSTTRRRPRAAAQLRDDADDHRRASGCSTRRGRADVPAAPAGPAATTRSRTPSTSTATRSTASSSDTVVAVRELDLNGIPPASATGSTTTPSTPTATASSRPTATSAPTDGQPVFFERGHPADRRRSATFEPRIYFGEDSPDVLDRRRARGPTPRRARLPGRQRDAVSRTRPTHGDGGVADRLALSTGCSTR